MNKSVWRWVALVTAIAGAFALWVLPLRAGRDREIRTAGDERLRTEQLRARAVLTELSSAVAGYRRAQSLARWQRASAKGGSVTIDASVPMDQRRAIDSVTAQAWKDVGVTSSRYAGVYVFFDSVAVPGMVARRAEPGRGAEVTYALPEATDGTRCIALVRVRRLPFSAASSSLLGPCAFYAAFGAPGTSVRNWLVRTRFLAVRYAQWAGLPAAALPPRASWYDLDAVAATCLTRAGPACLEAVNVVVPPASPWLRANFFTDDSLAASSGPYTMAGAGSPDARVLSEMVQEFGADRFRAFWTSALSPERAFQQATGVSLIDWTRARLERMAVAPVRAAVISGDSVLWLVVVIPVLIGLSARRREVVVRQRAG